MNKTIKIIIVALSVLIGIFSVWYFLHIVAYILISAVLSLIGRPLVTALGRINVKAITIPKSLRALTVLILFWFVAVMFFKLAIPLLVTELESLSAIDTQQVTTIFETQIANIETIIDKYKIGGEEEFTVQNFINNKLASIFSITFFTDMFGSLASILGNAFLAIFSITFITFFFLRDETLFSKAILMVVPDPYVQNFRHALSSIRYLLMRYFIGIIGQVTGIFTLVTLGMTIIGVGFQHGLVIGLIAACFNVIPYLGPVLGGATGVILGIATNLHLDYRTELLPLIVLMIIVIVIVQLIDNFIFQPFIFSNSVNAHPLEIFIVIMIAGSAAGVIGMILAIPVYTVFRVFAKEFFNQFKVVKKLTSKIH